MSELLRLSAELQSHSDQPQSLSGYFELLAGLAIGCGVTM